ncbi:hypothetical protein BSLG_008985 [Batrachochytrium salamandrivorans]|nr:hypothetical protein BSLG_008985 [Batrachochytrium salamandrivorans]
MAEPHTVVQLDGTLHNYLYVRFADGRDDVQVLTTSSVPTTVQDICDFLVSHDNALQSKFLRLLYRGRVLKPDETLATLLAPMDIFALLHPVFFHCSISDVPPQNSNEEPQLTRRVPGFDRLIELGMSIQEVEDLRTQFHSLRSQGADEPPENARDAEESWMENPVSTGHFDDTGGTHTDMLIGLMVGFFMGILILLWIKEAHMCNQRRQLGIITGLTINISFGVLRL